MCHDSLIRAMTHSYVSCFTHMYRDSLICAMMYHDSLICAMTHSYVSLFAHMYRDSPICAMMYHDSLICAMTHSYMSLFIHMYRDSLICAMMYHDSLIRAMTHSYMSLFAHMYHDAHMCAMMYHDSHMCAMILHTGHLWSLLRVNFSLYTHTCKRTHTHTDFSEVRINESSHSSISKWVMSLIRDTFSYPWVWLRHKWLSLVIHESWWVMSLSCEFIWLCPVLIRDAFSFVNRPVYECDVVTNLWMSWLINECQL